MGNTLSSTRRRQSRRSSGTTTQTVWDWEFRNGRLQPKPRKTVKTQHRPLFKRQPSNNYNWWIFNPNTPKKSKS